MKEILQVGLNSSAAAMIAAFMLGGQVSSAQDWKAQPDPKITGRLDMRQISGTGARVLTGFSGQTDGGRWGEYVRSAQANGEQQKEQKEQNEGRQKEPTPSANK